MNSDRQFEQQSNTMNVEENNLANICRMGWRISEGKYEIRE